MYGWAMHHPRSTSRPTGGLHLAWELLSAIGVTPADSRLRHAVLLGQRATADLVDDYEIAAARIRDLLIRYLDTRRPTVDYNSFRTDVAILAGLFWSDLQRHHPGIDTLQLTAEQAAAWRERVRVVVQTDGTQRPRTDVLAIFTKVRTFYLDIQRWAVEDATWAEWAVPSPVRRNDCHGFAKEQRAARSRMHQRIRERLPHLPLLADTAHRLHADAADLLGVARQHTPGDEFEVDGRRYCRLRMKGADRTSVYDRGAGNVYVRDLVSDTDENITIREDERFWAWAAIETLRHTGLRVEELLELTQLAIVSYRLPESNELIPLLQVVPSKNNEERLLLVSPELASVLATIVTRLRGQNDGVVPSIPRYDGYEREVGPPLPHLFQRQRGSRRTVISHGGIRRLINRTLAMTGLRDSHGDPLAYTPHDFRRMFATEAVAGGLPVHIAARLLGHASLDTTQAYVAVFQDDLVRTYRAFLAKRRAIRPAEEYRSPTEEEWAEFQQHFQTRKLELGTCGRPYGTPCQHEHAPLTELTP
ncbi:site-specific integrase [Amycolatopsis sp. Hca4]|uniref:tyrosine-type recombinase/integrase n=1 Tax=Amycolatopsis sp. Hca4 TaxID=2742131 RepID=UPI00159150F8|nr:site-specific integrase [Amycolatopsis sp. Hca4]QKV74119.1 site-specific integrase [Amycolatopsis sp. Hca4]